MEKLCHPGSRERCERAIRDPAENVAKASIDRAAHIPPGSRVGAQHHGEAMLRMDASLARDDRRGVLPAPPDRAMMMLDSRRAGIFRAHRPAARGAVASANKKGPDRMTGPLMLHALPEGGWDLARRPAPRKGVAGRKQGDKLERNRTGQRKLNKLRRGAALADRPRRASASGRR